MNAKIKLAFVVAAVAVVGGSVVYARSRPKEIETYEVTAQTAELYFIEKGEVTAGTTANVYPSAGGELLEVLVAENETVSQGAVICRIDPAPFENTIRQLESNINGYRAQIENLSSEERKLKDTLTTDRDNLQAQLKVLDVQKSSSRISKDEQLSLQKIIVLQSEKDLAMAEDQLSKAEVLFASGAMSKSEYDNARRDHENAVANLDKSRQQLTVIENGEQESSEEYINAMKESLTVQIAGLDKSIGSRYTESMTQYYEALIESDKISIELQRKYMEDCTVIAPISGIVTSLPVKGSNLVQSGSLVATIHSMADNRVEVLVNTNDIDSVHPGDQVELILRRRDGDKATTGTVTSIDSVAVIRLSAKGSEERLVKVTVVPDVQEAFKIGYDVDVKFYTYRENNVLIVPRSALFTEDDKDMVWLVSDGRLAETEVTTGRILRQEISVLGGLTEGAVIALDAETTGLKNGARVK